MDRETRAKSIDDQMERASADLAAGRFFEAERAARRCLLTAHAGGAETHDADYDRMARILMPLEEARRLKRQQALAAAEAGGLRLLATRDDLHAALDDLARNSSAGAGCWLAQPPLIGVDGRGVRDAADARKVPLLVITREPLTRRGLWPVVAVADVSVRAQVPPPRPLDRINTSPTRDAGDLLPDPAWFVAAAEALGRAAIDAVDPSEHPWHRVDALLLRLEAHPDDDRLHQALARACREAVATDPPPRPRKRPLLEDPFMF